MRKVIRAGCLANGTINLAKGIKASHVFAAFSATTVQLCRTNLRCHFVTGKTFKIQTTSSAVRTELDDETNRIFSDISNSFSVSISS
jgi:hypothetical protein